MNVRVFTGSRNAAPALELIDRALEGADLVLVGCCPSGTDAKVLRRALQLEIDVWIFTAKWKIHTTPLGYAGPQRNERMAARAAGFARHHNDVRCFAYPKGKSPGTRGCVRALKRRGLRVAVVEL